MSIPAYPLQWPAGWKRTPPGARARARFVKKERRSNTFRHADGTTSTSSWMGSKELSIADGFARIRAELARMGIEDDDVVISTDLHLRLDGLPRSSQREPDDAGVAVYWTDRHFRNEPPRCMAIDRYDRVADNLAAVAATLEAMRAIERHGGAEILNRAFTGFSALPAPGTTEWWSVLGVPRDAHASNVEAAYRRLRGQHHPDRGGNADEFHAVQHAYEAWQQEQRP